ncbi:hypothetical protein [Crossiella sp. CA198]|uniref:hypothetical protein n=1 Tax=Crossiella sp. CA198 TaxID=3455607 RepID=UPI003F8D3205
MTSWRCVFGEVLRGGWSSTLRATLLIIAIACGLALVGYAAGGVTGLAGAGTLVGISALAGRRTWGSHPGAALPGMSNSEAR